VSSLADKLNSLGADLLAEPMRISAYHDLPFAILRYDPAEEWSLRREARLLTTRLENAEKRVRTISLANLLWRAIDEAEELDAVVELERKRGFDAAQRQVATYLTDSNWVPLPELVREELDTLDAEQDVAFLVRAGAMSPDIYHMSRLLDEMQGKTLVPTILFYPGTIEGTTGLKFMGLASREVTGNYRVKIY
jgi:hypothetical protein